jgi:xanthine dehydrogenase iron-sulfur cluster and FAD-binding subunit A
MLTRPVVLRGGSSGDVDGSIDAAVEVEHVMVNSCLLPLFAVHRCAITTVEGVGDIEAPHPVQKVIAGSHGTQCGFCTPGMVMAVYCTLAATPTPSLEQLERCMDGNLCRCTGYRPLLDAAKTFAVDFDHDRYQRVGANAFKERDGDPDVFVSTSADKQTPEHRALFPPNIHNQQTNIRPPALPKEWLQAAAGGDVGATLTPHVDDEVPVLVASTDVLDTDAEVPLGERAKSHIAASTNVTRLASSPPAVSAVATLLNGTIHRPATLEQLLHLRASNPRLLPFHGAIDGGCLTGDSPFTAEWIDPSCVSELREVTVNPTPQMAWSVGCDVPISQFVALLQREQVGAAEHSNYRALIQQMESFGTPQARNGGVVGSLLWASDVRPVLGSMRVMVSA